MMTRFALSRAVVPTMLMLLGCGGAPDGQPAPVGSPVGSPLERLKSVERDLALGSRGDDVRALNEHLAAIGYFPNGALAHAQPDWKPIVSGAPDDLSVFDELTSEAVHHFQIHSGIEPSGLVDKTTLAALTGSRCGKEDAEADSGIRLHYSPTWGSRWPSNLITWRITGSDDITPTQARIAAANAFFQWSSTSGITFQETTGTPDIDIAFDECGGFLACVPVQPPASGGGGDIHVSTWPNWSQIGLQSVLTHEIGHALSLNHSPFQASMMWPGAQGFVSLSVEDKFAISTLYDTRVQRPSVARDIAASVSDLNTWMVSNVATSGGFQVYHWESDHWEITPGNRGAVRIAVASNGRPWIVDSNGATYRRTTASTFSGSWELMPGTAKDIGAGSDGSIWKVGTNPVNGGFGIYRWNGSGWNLANGTQGATRIAVDSMGTPWIVTSGGNVHRKTTNSASGGTWELLPQPSSGATDIAIYGRLPSSDGSLKGGYAWVVGGPNVYAWNEQDPIPGDTPGHREWRTVFNFPGSAAVAVGTNSNGNPYIVLSSGSIYTTAR